MMDTITFLDSLVQALQHAGLYNKNDQYPPAAVLWTDKERQWEHLLPALRARLPILTFGDYEPATLSGPAYWIRCVLAGTIPEPDLPSEITPIIYLPGISRQELRAVEECPKALQPLAELQFRGILWTQKNGKDWTLAAFLQSKDDGLGIEVAGDNPTREALQRAIERLADEPLAALRKAAPLKAAYFDKLLNPDEVRRILSWLNDPINYPKRLTAAEWAAFCSLCRQKYQFHPEQDGPLSAARLLAGQTGNWQLVWTRYVEAPATYPALPERLRAAGPRQPTLFETTGAWPQDNELSEGLLREDLKKIASLPLAEARQMIQALETQHAHRRDWVWTRLGDAPLVSALAFLYEVSEHTRQALTGNSLAEIASAYQTWGWKADAAVLRALAKVEKAEDVAMIKAALQAIYQPWLAQAAESFQKAAKAGYPDLTNSGDALAGLAKGSCILFSDALRMDVGQRLAAELSAKGLDCQVQYQLAAFPSTTATAKPAISPARTKFTGQGMPELTPGISAGASPVTADKLRSVLQDQGLQVLGDHQTGNPLGSAWTETGALDAFGHQQGWKMARHIEGELDGLKNRIFNLLESGWKQVVIVTDHGWLLLPDGMPKATLPEHLTVLRKGRCARLKPLSNTDQQILPWYWDASIDIATAPGIHCYEAGKEYEHGGLSAQECVTPVIFIRRASGAAMPEITIEKSTWKGLRCTVQLSGAFTGLSVDLRSKAGDWSTSLVSAQTADATGTVSLLVEDEDLVGQAAFVVVSTSDGLVCAQVLTTVGGD
jgi:hypothetical protein